MKYTIQFKTQEELVQYFGGLDKVPSKCLALVDEVPYTSSTSPTAPVMNNVLLSSTNNNSSDGVVAPSGVSAVDTAKSQAIVIEDKEEIEDDALYWSNMVCFGQDPAPTSEEEPSTEEEPSSNEGGR